MPSMPSLNIAVSKIKKEQTINGSTRSTEDVTSHLGGIGRDIIQPGQEMYIATQSFNGRSQIPPDVARKIEAQSARRLTQSSLDRRALRTNRQPRTADVDR